MTFGSMIMRLCPFIRELSTSARMDINKMMGALIFAAEHNYCDETVLEK